MRPRVGGSLRTGVSGEDVEHAGAELAVLVLLAPDARRRVHQRGEGAVGPAERPHSGEFVGVHRRILADEADGADALPASSIAALSRVPSGLVSGS